MLSFLQERLGRSPPKPQKNMTRQETIVSAFNRINGRNSSKEASTTPSLTTATSMTDSSSELTDSSAKKDVCTRTSTRSRSSVGSYNENVLSGQLSRLSRKQGSEKNSNANRKGSIVRDEDNYTQERLLQEGMQALDEDWDLGAMPGENLNLPIKEEGGVQRRRSTRLDMVDNASSVMAKTTGVLGKRGRETVEAGMEKLHSLTGANKRSRLRPRQAEKLIAEGRLAKRARFSEVSKREEPSPEPLSNRKSVKKPLKLWLSQGLYVGQHPEFDPRLTETKNKMKRPSTKPNQSSRNRAMPLPMFAGERTLEKGRDFKLPFDVFSPLPPGQPKPDEWKKTHKNIFIGDAADMWKKAKPQEYSTCECTPETGCGEDCHNRFMLYECDDNNCKIGADHCTNRAFADLRKRCKAGGKYRIGVEVMKTIDRGYGVRANRTFEPNQIIVEYTGEIITQDECDDRMNKRYKDAECYYLMDFDQSMVLDATRGSIARFINHSCAPNCRMIKWTVSGKPRMALFAGDNGIMTGEELTYDYNFDPFSAKNVQECRCGAEGCRGVLGPKPKEIKEALRPIATGGKRKLQQVMEDAVETVTKKRKIAVPSSVKSAFANVKAQTSRRLSQATALTATLPQKERLMKKASERSLREVNRKTIEEKVGGKMRRRTTITYSKQCSSVLTLNGANGKDASRRRHSSGSLLVENETKKGSDHYPVKKEKQEARLMSKKDSVETKPVSVAANVVRTIRRSERGTPGKTIFVIGDDEFKGWR